MAIGIDHLASLWSLSGEPLSLVIAFRIGRFRRRNEFLHYFACSRDVDVRCFLLFIFNSVDVSWGCYFIVAFHLHRSHRSATNLYVTSWV